MACDAATLAAALAEQFCGTDYRANRLALAGQLYRVTGIDAADAMEGAKCFAGVDDASLFLIMLTALCYGGS